MSRPPIPPDSDVTIIPATPHLQLKVGMGSIDPDLIKKGRDTLNINRAEFSRVAGPLFLDLQTQLRVNPVQPQQLIRPIMDLKANGKMFGYDLITDLANVMLAFLETVKQADRDVIDLMHAHLRTLRAIVDRKMSGKGGASGQRLVYELLDACNRYLKKERLPLLRVSSVI